MPQANDQKHVTPKQRPHELPNQKLVVSSGKQDLSLHDYVECSLILQYNSRYVDCIHSL